MLTAALIFSFSPLFAFGLLLLSHLTFPCFPQLAAFTADEEDIRLAQQLAAERESDGVGTGVRQATARKGGPYMLYVKHKVPRESFTDSKDKTQEKTMTITANNPRFDPAAERITHHQQPEPTKGHKMIAVATCHWRIFGVQGPSSFRSQEKVFKKKKHFFLEVYGLYISWVLLVPKVFCNLSAICANFVSFLGIFSVFLRHFDLFCLLVLAARISKPLEVFFSLPSSWGHAFFFFFLVVFVILGKKIEKKELPCQCLSQKKWWWWKEFFESYQRKVTCRVSDTVYEWSYLLLTLGQRPKGPDACDPGCTSYLERFC